MVAWFSPQIGPDFGQMVSKVKQVFDANDIMNPDKVAFMRPPEKKEGQAKLNTD